MSRDPGIFLWRGEEDADYANSGNWLQSDAVTYWTSGDHPGWDGTLDVAVSGDAVSFDTTATYGPSGGDYSANGVLESFTVSNVYDKTIGASGSPLCIELATNTSLCTIDAKKAGAIWLAGGGATAGLGTVVVTNALGALHICGITKMLIAAKASLIDYYYHATYGGTLTDLSVAYATQPITDVTLTLGLGITPPNACSVAGGRITNNSDGIADVNMSNGIWTQSYQGSLTHVGLHGGTYNWDAGIITRVDVFGGTLDMTRTTTDKTGQVVVWPAGTAKINRTTDETTWLVRYLGGKLQLSIGQEIVST